MINQTQDDITLKPIAERERLKEDSRLLLKTRQNKKRKEYSRRNIGIIKVRDYQ